MTIRLWNVENGEQDGDPLRGHTDVTYSISFSFDGLYIVSGSKDKTIIIWDVRGRKVKLGPLKGHGGTIRAIEFSPSGDTIASGLEDESIRIWDVRTGDLIRSINSGGKVYSVTFSPDGLNILAGGRFGLKMWDTVDITATPKDFSGELIYSRYSDVFDISFAPDGTRFVTASGAPEIQVWDALSGGERTKSLYEREYILTIAVSPSSLLIASGSKNSTVYLWDAVSGELIAGPWYGHEGNVSSACFSPDERFVASGSYDNTVRLWNLK